MATKKYGIDDIIYKDYDDYKINTFDKFKDYDKVQYDLNNIIPFSTSL